MESNLCATIGTKTEILTENVYYIEGKLCMLEVLAKQICNINIRKEPHAVTKEV